MLRSSCDKYTRSVYTVCVLEIDAQTVSFVPMGLGRIGDVIDYGLRHHSNDARAFTKGRDSWHYTLSEFSAHDVLWYQFGWEYVCDDGWIVQVTFTDEDTYKVLQGWVYKTKDYPEIEAMKQLLEVLRAPADDL